jgi:transglutaminase-like putative cysteine protease
MRAFVKQGKADPVVIDLARQLIGDLRQKDYVSEAKRLFYFVRDNIRYVQDPRNVEMVQAPRATLNIGQGDCDDKSTLLAALLESINHPTRFRAVGQESDLSHVYVETKIGPRWFAADATEPVPFGWAPPGMRARPMVVRN